MTISRVLAAVRQLPMTQLAQAVPHLRPFGRDEADDLLAEFSAWLARQRPDPGELTWHDAFNRWTGATERQPGRVRFARSQCPACRGRRIDMRRGVVCLTCRGGSRRVWVDTVAVFQHALDDEATPVAPPPPRPGDRIRVTGLMPDDPAPMPIGAEGTVTAVNAFGDGPTNVQVSVDWDGNGRTLMLLGSDPFVVINDG